MLVNNRRYFSLERLAKAAKELSEATGRECIPTQADVRSPATLKEAVAKTIAKFGRIDYVICGTNRAYPCEFIQLILTLFRRCWKFLGPHFCHVRERVQNCYGD